MNTKGEFIMSKLEEKVRRMVKENGRQETRRKINSFLSHLNSLIIKANSIEDGLDVEHDIQDLKRMLEILDKR